MTLLGSYMCVCVAFHVFLAQLHDLPFLKHTRLNVLERWTRASMMGISVSGPAIVARAPLEPKPKTETATARANSKLLLAAVNAMVAHFG
mmetsp:Transcript_9519/g.27081  ORF Transcript_9519/g.27081 Transcript_9519/m.27081 type:complete len:90 (-) Transcript_9519:1131-1400(-)